MVATLGATVAACSGAAPASPLDGLRLDARGSDVLEVWVCRVPAATRAPIYGRLPRRLSGTAEQLVERIGDGVTTYFTTASYGRYVPRLVAGGDVRIGSDDDERACIDRALAAASPSANGIVVIADAEHDVGRPGGFGSPGAGCGGSRADDATTATDDDRAAGPPLAPVTGCPVRRSQRWAYVGAADLAAQWGDRPPLDLLEHEIGHMIGLIHSGVGDDGAYLSPLDLMSNSAAPRLYDEERRDGPALLALHRVLAGWLDRDLVRVVAPAALDADTATGTVDVALVTAALDPAERHGRIDRMAVLVVDATHLVTVEVIAASGPDGHLPHDGIAVHVVRLDPSDRHVLSIDPVPAAPQRPVDDLLERGEEIEVLGWRIDVVAVDGERWTVRVRPSDER